MSMIYVILRTSVLACTLVVLASSSPTLTRTDGEHLEPASVANGPRCPPPCTCSSHFKVVSCINKGLQEIPKDIPHTATELYLSQNLLTEIPAGAFDGLWNLTSLSLVQNRIDRIADGAFDGLVRLKRLYLTQNKLTDELGPEAFRGLSALNDLYLTQNLFTMIPNFKYATNLSKLSIDNNHLVSAKFGQEFENSTLSTVGLANNPSLTKITDDDFRFLPLTVRKIDLSRCPLTELTRALCRLEKLQSLSLSYVPLVVTLLQSVMDSLAKCRGLSSLDLSGTISFKFEAEVFRNLSSVPLKTLNLAHMTNFDLVPGDMFRYFPMLETLDMSQGEFTLIVGNISSMPRLKRLTLSKNKKLAKIPKLSLPNLNFLDLSGSTTGLALDDTFFTPVPNLATLRLAKCGIRTVKSNAFVGLSRLQFLDLSGNEIGGSNLPADLFTPLVKLQTLNLKGNKMTAIGGESTLFEAMINLQSLDFSDNRCSMLPSSSIFANLVALRNLDLSGNMLGVSVIGQTAGSRLLAGLTSLEKLHLQGNQIKFLPPDIFNETVSLRMVNLTGNLLTTWNDTTFNTSGNLSVVDMTSNRIAIVTQSMIAGLPLGDVHLNLSGNPFACWCDLIWFRRWIAAHPNDTTSRLPGLSSYRCNSPKSMEGHRLLDFIPDDIVRSCFPPPWLMISIGVGVGSIILVVVIASFMYRHRWSLRLRIYYVGKRCGGRRRRTHNGYRRGLDDDGDDNSYDLLVSYFLEDDSGDWVKNKLGPILDVQDQASRPNAVVVGNGDDVEEDGLDVAETRRLFGNGYRVFYEDKDVMPNKNTIGEIDEAMRASKKVMIVASEMYVEDSRRQYEVKMAVEHGADNIIVVLWQDESVGPKLPRFVHPLLKDALVWKPNDRDNQELFWTGLSERLQRQDEIA